MNLSNHLKLFLLALMPIISTVTRAADIARDVRVGEAAPDLNNGGFFEIGAGVGLLASPVVGSDDDGATIKLFLAGSYQWRGLFVESIDGSSSNISFGYNAWNTPLWSFDAIASVLNNDIFVSDSKELKGLENRQGDFLIGARATGYFGDYILQLKLLDGVTHRHDGEFVGLEGGYSWQRRNWNYHTVLGWQYGAKELVNYYLGVSPEEALASTVSEYQAGAGSLFTAEIGATYPISEHWVFRGTARVEHLTENLSNSPIIGRKNHGFIFATFSYVF